MLAGGLQQSNLTGSQRHQLENPPETSARLLENKCSV